MDAEIFIRYGGASAAMVRVFWELCVVFCDEVECRATVGHVTQSIVAMRLWWRRRTT